MQPKIIFSNEIGQQLEILINEISPSKVFILTDSLTEGICRQQLSDRSFFQSTFTITIPNGESNKNISSLQHIWSELINNGADRKALLLNFGGGMITDIGGFAAASFKRGIRYINVPTTLLGAVDASIGGKTAINFDNIKNAIGAFHQPVATIVSSTLFESLRQEDILSGFGEMFKHALLKDHEYTTKLLKFDLHHINWETFLPALQESIMVKANVVMQDLKETGIRKALNFGHTIGHAFESFSLENGKPISHGIAIAYGIIAELILSHLHLKFPSEYLHQISNFIKSNYGPYYISCKNYPKLMEYMRHDKKNTSPDFNFTLLSSIGNPVIDNQINEEDVKNALDIFSDLMQ